jgi:uroporphyrin-III C-methyltransferase / precorrin-2 dehydrogenase / sirohydrochlorin ferrochelatase
VRYYPVFLDLASQRCVVLGGAKFATEKVEGLLEAGACVRVVAARLSPALEGFAGDGRIDVVRRDYRAGDLAGARLVVDASEDQEINRLSWQEAEAAGILINVVDRPEQCRFIAPAIVRRDPLLIAISTSGESPFLASAMRARIERWVGREWGPFVAMVGEVRRTLRRRDMPLAEQTRVYKRLLSSDVRSLLRAGRSEEACRLADGIAAGRVDKRGRVALVGAGPGDPSLMTVRARELIADADFVLHDALVAPEVLAFCGPGAQLEDVGKRGGRESVRQAKITARLIELARAGHSVVRLKGGDPFVFGRGGEELRDLREACIDVVVVPGITAALAAPAAADIAVTERGVAASVAITTARGDGNLDRLVGLAKAADTLVVLMVRADLAAVAAVIARAVGGSRPAALISNATLPSQRSVTGPLDRIAKLADEAQIEAPATLVVGDVVPAALSPAGVAVRGTSIDIDSYSQFSS